MSDIKIFNDITLQGALGDIREAYRTHGYVEVNVKSGKKRSLDQNALSHAWYQQMAREDRQHDELGHKCYCKLHHGVPILRAEDADFKLFYDTALIGLSYEQKIESMKFVPVTSCMNKAQLSKYLEAVKGDYETRQVILEFPDAARWAA